MESLNSLDDLLRPDVLAWVHTFNKVSRKLKIYDKIEEMWGIGARKKFLGYLLSLRWKQSKMKAETYPLPEKSMVVPVKEVMAGVQKAIYTGDSALSLELACLHVCGAKIKDIARDFEMTQRDVRLRVAEAKELALRLDRHRRSVFWKRVDFLSNEHIYSLMTDPAALQKQSLSTVLKLKSAARQVLKDLDSEENRLKEAKGVKIIDSEADPELEAKYDEQHKAYLALLEKDKKKEKDS